MRQAERLLIRHEKARTRPAATLSPDEVASERPGQHEGSGLCLPLKSAGEDASDTMLYFSQTGSDKITPNGSTDRQRALAPHLHQRERRHCDGDGQC